MEQISWWHGVAGVLGAMGGLEWIKWMGTRKSAARMATAQAGGAEFHLLQETNEFLQRQLQGAEERFVQQTERLRHTQDELFKAKEAEHQARLELALKRCDTLDCWLRKPPNAFTPGRQPEIAAETQSSNPLNLNS